jgi:hypothetical protein
VLIENYYISGIYSTNPRNESSFYVDIYLPSVYTIVNEVLDLLTTQLAFMHATGYPTSATCMISAIATTITDYPPADKLDDDPIETTTINIPPQLTAYPYKYRVTLPNNSLASHGLLLLANRHATWTTTIPETFILTHLPIDIRKRLLQQAPAIIRTNTTPPKPARDTCSIYNHAFAGLTPT